MPVFNVIAPFVSLVEAADEGAAITKLVKHVENKTMASLHIDEGCGWRTQAFESEPVDPDWVLR